ncbi:MAG: cytochrome P450, partial [Burkholderiales bacterium]|nr:cytochrome P450 [Burkholderiales bacterium]
SNQLGNRITTEQVQLGDVVLPAQTRITLCIGAANRDPSQFAQPEQFDIARNPNRHLAFASGTHACVGMSLARLEGQIALGRFISRYPRYRIENRIRSPRVRFRGFLQLPVVLG